MKAQMKYQKILAFTTLILAALGVVLALLYCSGILYELQSIITSKKAIMEKVVVDNTGVKDKTKEIVVDLGADNVVEYTQHINNVLVVMAIVFVVLTTLIFIMASHKRRNYYITNYISIAIVGVYAIVLAIIFIVAAGHTLSLLKEVDMESWKKYSEERLIVDDVDVGRRYPNINYTANKSTIALAIVYAVVLFVDVAAWVLNVIWKIKLMQGEKKLLAQGVNIDKEVA